MKTSLAIFLIGCLSTPAAAQVATRSDDQTARDAEGTVAEEEEIVVTAQRVESLASKTPVALTVLTGNDLREAGITDPSTLPNFVPNFAIDPGNSNRITIRGITSFDTTNKGDPSAAFLLDGVYLARGGDVDGTFFDIARIEVLRGPQGTLYGRNSTAGVVNVISNRPVDALEAAANVTIGNFGTYQTDGMVNVPVGDALALRAAVSYDRRDNYLRPAAGDPIRLGAARNNISARLQGLITFSDKAGLLLKVDYRSVNADSDQSSVLMTNFFDRTDPLNPKYIEGDSDVQRTLTYLQAIRGSTNLNNWGISGEFTWDFGPLEITYLGSRRETKTEKTFNFFFFRATPFFLDDRHTQDSHELRFATTGDGPFKAQFGTYYFREKVRTTTVFPIPGPLPFLAFTEDPTKATSYAVFGQATYDVTDALHLTAGIRYTHDKKSRLAGTAFQAGRSFNPATDLLFQQAQEVSFSKTTWRVGLDYDLNEKSLLYAAVSTGYKSGGFNDGCLAGTVVNGQVCNQPRPPEVLFYEPETLMAYEVGAKLRLADKRLQLNAAAFYYDYKNLQLQSIVLLNGTPAGQITNAGKARVKGVELDAVFVPNERHRLTASFTYLDAYYVNYFPRGEGVPPSFAGKSLDNSPDFTFALGYTYTQPISDNGALEFNIYSRYSDSYVVSSFTVPAQFRQPSFTKTNVSLTYRPNDRDWYVQLFAKNLENNIQITSAALDSVNISEPRTFGIRTGVKF